MAESQVKGGKKGAGIVVKVGTMYEGWKDDTGKRSVLAEKTVYAGVETSEVFHDKWESKIQSIYDPSKIGIRVLNGAGGSWIRDEYDSGTIHQLDRFHLIKMIRQNVSSDDIRKEMLKQVRADNEGELLSLAQIYYDSVCAGGNDESEEQKSKELKEYLDNHKGKPKLHADYSSNEGEAKKVGVKKCKSHGKAAVLS